MATMGSEHLAPTCGDCGAVYGSGVSLIWRDGAWYCADREGCAARVAQRADALVARVEAATPRDGETLGAFEFMTFADTGWWVYTAGYADPALCKRRARALTAGLGVDVWVYGPMPAGRYAGDYIAYVPAGATAALRAALAPAPAPIWPDDEAAHVDDATFQRMIDDEIALEMASEFFGDDEAAHVAETVDELHETARPASGRE